MRRRGRFGFGFAMAVAGLVAIGGTALAADRTVDIAGFAFAPGTATVTVGDTVTWTNSDQVGHTATSAGAFDTESIAPGGNSAITFSTAGTFAYVCAIHPAMTGTVVVEAAAGGGSSEPTAPATDTATAGEAVAGDGGGSLAPLLAILLAAMTVMTLVTDRRVRTADAARID